MIRYIRFKNYKAFSNWEEIELRPVTLIIGKNSSGKSSVLKLIRMIGAMVRGVINKPEVEFDGFTLGGSYSDLFHNRENTGLALSVEFDNGLRAEAEYYIDNDDIKIFNHIMSHPEYGILKMDEHQVKLIDDNVLQKWNVDSSSLLLGMDYLGPLRCVAPSCIRFHGYHPCWIGSDGSGAYNLLLNAFKKESELFSFISSWMKDNMEGQELDFSNTANNSGNYTLWVKRKNAEVNISEVGQGVAQVLPVVTLVMCAYGNTVNMIEQPELHLHPASHAKVADLIGRQAKNRGNVFVVESHSKNLLLGFKKLVVDKKIDFNCNDIAIYYVKETSDGATLKRIRMDEKGVFDDWPYGVFSETSDLTREINKLLI